MLSIFAEQKCKYEYIKYKKNAKVLSVVSHRCHTLVTKLHMSLTHITCVRVPKQLTLQLHTTACMNRLKFFFQNYEIISPPKGRTNKIMTHFHRLHDTLVVIVFQQSIILFYETDSYVVNYESSFMILFLARSNNTYKTVSLVVAKKNRN